MMHLFTILPIVSLILLNRSIDLGLPFTYSNQEGPVRARLIVENNELFKKRMHQDNKPRTIGFLPATIETELPDSLLKNRLAKLKYGYTVEVTPESDKAVLQYLVDVSSLQAVAVIANATLIPEMCFKVKCSILPQKMPISVKQEIFDLSYFTNLNEPRKLYREFDCKYLMTGSLSCDINELRNTERGTLCTMVVSLSYISGKDIKHINVGVIPFKFSEFELSEYSKYILKIKQ
jgi:hypothetical protein